MSWVLVADVVLLVGLTLVARAPVLLVVAAHLFFLSLVTFLVFGLDKWRARREKRRVSELNLIGLAILGGALGGFIGMNVWNHKGRHLTFRVLVPIALFIHVGVLTYFWITA